MEIKIKKLIAVLVSMSLFVLVELTLEYLGPDWDFSYLRTLGYLFSGAVGFCTYVFLPDRI